MHEISVLKAIIVMISIAIVVAWITVLTFPSTKADFHRKYDIFADSQSLGNLACKNMTQTNDLILDLTCPDVSVVPVNGKCDVSTMVLYKRTCLMNSLCTCKLTYKDYQSMFHKGETREFSKPCNDMASEFALNPEAFHNIVMMSSLGTKLYLNPFQKFINNCLGKTKEIHYAVYKQAKGITWGLLALHSIDSCLLIYLMFLLYASYDCFSVMLESIWLFIDILTISFCIYLIWQFNTVIEVDKVNSRVKRQVPAIDVIYNSPEECIDGLNGGINLSYREYPLEPFCFFSSKSEHMKRTYMKAEINSDDMIMLMKSCVENPDSSDGRKTLARLLSMYKARNKECISEINSIKKVIEDAKKPYMPRLIQNQSDSGIVNNGDIKIVVSRNDSMKPKEVEIKIENPTPSNISVVEQRDDHPDVDSERGDVPDDEESVSEMLKDPYKVPNKNPVLGSSVGAVWWESLPWGSIVTMLRDMLIQCFGDNSSAILVLLNYGKYINMVLFTINMADCGFIVYSIWDEYKSVHNTILIVKSVRLALTLLLSFISLMFLFVENTLIRVIRES